MSLRTTDRPVGPASSGARPLGLCVLLLLSGLGASLAFVPGPVDATVATSGPGEAVITVRVGGDRLSGAVTDTGPAGSAVSGVGGAQLALFDAATDPTPIHQTWATCVSDADGDCSFVVPGTDVGGGNRDRVFVIKQTQASPGWFANGSLRTGFDAGGLSSTAYRFSTGPELRAGTTYSSTSDFMYQPADSAHLNVVTSSSGIWQQSRTNPPLDPGCGLDVALIFDTSNGLPMPLLLLKNGANAVVDALAGTRSRVAAFSFSETSPGALAGPNHPALLPVSTPAEGAAAKAVFATWASAQGTNADRGLFAAAAAPDAYDVAVLISDGGWTSYGSPLPSPRSTVWARFKEIEYAIASANALKAEGTRVIGVGVGAAADLTPAAGAIGYDGSNGAVADRFKATQFGALGAALQSAASGPCPSSVTVTTSVVPSGNLGEDVAGATPVEGGFEFTGATTDAGLGGLPASQSTTEESAGAVTFPVALAHGVDTAPATFTPGAGGYRVVTQGGQNATCRLENGDPVAVTNDGPGFVVPVGPERPVSCAVYVAREELGASTVPGVETPPDPIASLALDQTVDRVGDVDGDGILGVGDLIHYAYVVTNTGSEVLTGLVITSPLVGAVVCPETVLAPQAAVTCLAHAPYVITPQATRRGFVRSIAKAAALDPGGAATTSEPDTVITPTGVRAASVGQVVGAVDGETEAAGGGGTTAAGPGAGGTSGNAGPSAGGTTGPVSGLLPNTGGPELGFAIAGLLLILLGTTLLRRRPGRTDQSGP